MGGRLDPSVAAVRVAVRTDLARLAAQPGGAGPVLAACSGGADSTALAAALAFEAVRGGVPAGAVTVDHGLQEGSRQRADDLAGRLGELGLDPVSVSTVTVDPGALGLEAAARSARYAALTAAAVAADAAAVLLGHTRDDQAETVLLGLARGSGARSLAGMRAVSGRYRRPLLALPRALTRAACRAQGLPVWDDPHNDEPRFTRVRARQQVLPVLETALGPGVRAALARTADQLREDADALDALAEAELARLISTAAPTVPVGSGALDVHALALLPAALRSRVLRSWLLAAGAPAGGLSYQHVAGVRALVEAWHGQRHLDLPGGLQVRRRDNQLIVYR